MTPSEATTEVPSTATAASAVGAAGTKGAKEESQGVERFLTYAWIGIVAVLLIGAFYWLGVFTPYKWAQEKTCSGFLAFSCSHKVTEQYTIITLTNRIGATLELNSASCDFPGCKCTAQGAVAPRTNITVSCTHARPAAPGQPFPRGTIYVTYTNAIDGMQYTDKGEITGKVEVELLPGQ
jgi:hypothetical protein